MSEKFTEYLGYCIKIKCDTFICSGEIVSVDENTVVITNSSINEIITPIKFLGINQTLINNMDIIKPPKSKKISNDADTCAVSNSVNVYTSSTQPPAIKRGGPSSALHRKWLKSNNSPQETIHKSRSSNFPEKKLHPMTASSGNVSQESNNINSNNSFCNSVADFQKPDSFHFNDAIPRTRKTSNNTLFKEPSWMNYTVNGDSPSFDFESNMALFNKNKFCSNPKRNLTESPESSDSGGIQISFDKNNDINKKPCNPVNNKPEDLSNQFNCDSSRSFDDFIKQINDIKDADEDKDVFTELTLMGIIPPPQVADKLNDCPSKTCDQETQLCADNLLGDRNFQQQPDIVQEVTKSQLCNSDIQILEHSSILSINTSIKDFQNFSDYWKLDNDFKFPTFTFNQMNKLFECANKFGYDVRAIAEYVGKSLCEFVVDQVKGFNRLNNSKYRATPKIVVLLSNCQTSVFVASMARFLVGSGCYIIAYFDDNCHKPNEDVDIEMKLLKNTFCKYSGSYSYNYITSRLKDFDRKSFDYIINGLENEANTHPPCDDLIEWSFKQNAPILTVNPTKIGSLPWKIAAFIGVPTTDSKNLLIRTRYGCENGFLKPRTDGIVGLEIDKMFKKPDGLVLLFNVNLPIAVYKLMNLNYKSPFNSKNWIRMYRENELIFVE